MEEARIVVMTAKKARGMEMARAKGRLRVYRERNLEFDMIYDGSWMGPMHSLSIDRHLH